MSYCGTFSPSATNRPASLKGSGWRSTPFTTLKIALFAPMPSTSVSTATAVKPGFFSSIRNANFKSWSTVPISHLGLIE